MLPVNLMARKNIKNRGELKRILIIPGQRSFKDLFRCLCTRADSIPLTINQAIPRGLILNELITNSHKHAFDRSKKGRTRVDMKQSDGSVQLTVEDNGRGLPGDLDLESPTTLGLTLVRSLSKQLLGGICF